MGLLYIYRTTLSDKNILVCPESCGIGKTHDNERHRRMHYVNNTLPQ